MQWFYVFWNSGFSPPSREYDAPPEAQRLLVTLDPINIKHILPLLGLLAMDNESDNNRLPKEAIKPEDLTRFFISHLNRIYCAKNQLVEKLPQLGRMAHFLDLKQAINETVEVVENQMKRMREIFILLDTFYTYESCVGLIGLLDEAFQSIGPEAGKPVMRDFAILFYMQNIESVETASFKMMLLTADRMNNPKVAQLVRECYDEANEDRVLFKEITANYV